MGDATRQHYKLATGQSLTPAPKGPSPGAARGGAVKKHAGGLAYRKGGKAGKSR